ncbi:MAG TPA: DUF190 domain-containing protein [Aggregatilineales bacterium]|nr:DUF190 domain-containing protein [Aggregatilineales bacterium]
MPETIQSKRLTIYLTESDTYQGHSLPTSILETLLKASIARAVLTRSSAGFGIHKTAQKKTVDVKSGDLPAMITVIDSAENIDKAIALVMPMLRDSFLTVEDVQVITLEQRSLQPLPVDRLVSEIMTRRITTVTPDTPARQVVELLLGKLFKAVPVIDADRHVVGIISDGDLLHKAGMPVRLAVGERLEADDLREFITRVSHEKTAREIMTTPVITAWANETVGTVVRRMVDHNLKRMPVVDEWRKLVGMVSRLDILRVIAGDSTRQQEQGSSPQPGKTVGDVMSQIVPKVYANEDLTDILKKMLQADMRRVIVLDEHDHPVGVITDGDLVARVSPAVRQNILRSFTARVLGTGSLRRGDVTARDLMSFDVLTVSKDLSIVDAIALMIREKRKRLVVVDSQQHPIGMVDRQTLMAASLGLTATGSVETRAS